MGGVRVQFRRGRPTMAAMVLAAVLVDRAGGADPPGHPESRAALDACHANENRPAAERAALLDAALRAAEAAVAAHDDDALAHFAVFCALGERMQLDGVSVAALSNTRRLRKEIDRTLELAPDFADALAGKGALLVELPRLLGGDVVLGEQLLRRALAIDADYIGARLQLAEFLSGQGRRADALREARTALSVAERKQSPEDVTTARALIDRLTPAAP